MILNILLLLAVAAVAITLAVVGVVVYRALARAVKLYRVIEEEAADLHDESEGDYVRYEHGGNIDIWRGKHVG